MHYLRLVIVTFLVLAGQAHAQTTLHPGRLAPSSMNSSEVEGGAVASVGPGDTLYMTVFGRPELAAQVTVDTEGKIVVPFLGSVAVAQQSPSAIARMISEGLRTKGYLRDPQVSIEVVKVRSRLVSILGEVARPGRYPIEGRLTVLELLAQAGGVKDTADDKAVLLRRGNSKEGGQDRSEIAIGNRQAPDQQIQDSALQAGDVLYVPLIKRFYVYGEVSRSGAYPMEPGLDVMRALALSGGLTQRASSRRIEVSRKNTQTGAIERGRVSLTDPVLPGDVLYVDERLF